MKINIYDGDNTEFLIEVINDRVTVKTRGTRTANQKWYDVPNSLRKSALTFAEWYIEDDNGTAILPGP